jgi:hypothetical protein
VDMHVRMSIKVSPNREQDNGTALHIWLYIVWFGTSIPSGADRVHMVGLA